MCSSDLGAGLGGADMAPASARPAAVSSSGSSPTSPATRARSARSDFRGLFRSTSAPCRVAEGAHTWTRSAGPAAAVGAGAYGLGFDDFIEIAGKFKFGSLLYFYVSQIIDAMKHGDEAQKIADAVKVKVKNLLGI